MKGQRTRASTVSSFPSQSEFKTHICSHTRSFIHSSGDRWTSADHIEFVHSSSISAAGRAASCCSCQSAHGV